MQITSIAPWMGGKRNLAAIINAELGSHRAYWEPFCGSLAVLLAKPPCTMETANDLHGDLTNLARVVQDATAGPELFARLSRTLMAEELFNESAAVIRGEDYGGPELDLDRAYHYCVTAWLGRNGVAGTKDYNAGFCLRFTLKGGHAATRWRSVVDSLPAWHDRLRNVNILRRDAFELLPRIEDAPRTAIYVDPPYFHKSKRYRYDFEAEDHQRLAAALQRFRQARVVVSYYEDPSLDQLYPGWTQRRIPITKAMANQGRRGSGASRAVEILLLNGPSVAEQARLFRDPMTCETPCSESEPARG